MNRVKRLDTTFCSLGRVRSRDSRGMLSRDARVLWLAERSNPVPAMLTGRGLLQIQIQLNEMKETITSKQYWNGNLKLLNHVM